MKSHSTQFGERENTASSRQHASRFAVNSSRLRPVRVSHTLRGEESSLQLNPSTTEVFDPSESMPEATATGEDTEKHLLTVSEIAHTLRVSVSWVYERTRRQGRGRLPHIKLGKYLRFEINAVREWLGQLQRN
jgi:excisionase family DNA binding protein